MLLGSSSLAFASKKAGLCQSSFSSSNNPELQTVIKKTTDVTKKSIVDEVKNTSRLVRNQLNEQKANVNAMAEKAFPPLYNKSEAYHETENWQVVPQQDPMVKKDVQQRLWDFVLHPSLQNLNYRKTEKQLSQLVESGADIYAKDEKGLTPLDYAVALGNSELVILLIDASQKSIKSGYRSFIKRATGFSTQGYSVSDYNRALRIAKRNQTESFKSEFQNGNTAEISRPISNKSNEEIISELKNARTFEYLQRGFGALFLGYGGMAILATASFIEIIGS